MSSKRILITGASSGIGAATARLLAAEGHEVLLAARRQEKLEALCKEIPKAKAATLDVSDSQSIATFVRENKIWLENVDVLVNNAGLALGRELFQDALESDLSTMLDTNVKGLLLMSRAILDFMIPRKRGQIVNLGSVAGITPYQGGTAYCATKAAVHMITNTLRLDLGGTGIRVATVAPGRVAETEFSEVRFKGDKEKAKTVYEGYRVMTASDVARAIVWIISQPEHINIQEIVMMPTDQSNAHTLAPLKGSP